MTTFEWVLVIWFSCGAVTDIYLWCQDEDDAVNYIMGFFFGPIAVLIWMDLTMFGVFGIFD